MRSASYGIPRVCENIWDFSSHPLDHFAIKARIRLIYGSQIIKKQNHVDRHSPSIYVFFVQDFVERRRECCTRDLWCVKCFE